MTVDGSRSQVLAGFCLERGVRVPMRDGAVLVADVYLPDGWDESSSPVPVIMERTPYDRSRISLYQLGTFFARRGYGVVVQDCRGRYDSDGTFRYMVGPDPQSQAGSEAEDGYDTVEWIACQRWSDGRVGTTGQSYTGATQQALAVLRPPHLVTQVILDAGYSYRRSALRHGGAFTLGMVFPQAVRMAADSKEAQQNPHIRAQLNDALANLHIWAARHPIGRGESPLALVPSYEDYYLAMAETVDDEGFWRSPIAGLDHHIDSYPDIPVCFVTSWYGHHAHANFEKWNALSTRISSSVCIVSGHWLHGGGFMEQRHVGEVDFGNESALNLNDFRLRWFDHHLKALPNGSDMAKISVFVMGGGPGDATPEGRIRHGGRWIDAGSWPPAGVAEHSLRLSATMAIALDDGHAVEPGSLAVVADPNRPVPTIGGAVQDPALVSGFLYGGAFDQRERADLVFCSGTAPLADRSDVLVFRSPILEEPLEVIGAVEVRVWITSSAADTDITVKLIDEFAASVDFSEGFALNLCDDIRRIRRGSVADGTPRDVDIRSTPTEVVFDSMVIANRFNVGHRLRLDVSTSNWPMFDVSDHAGGVARRGNPANRVAVITVHIGDDTPSRLMVTARV